jgi:hypothetical protein
MKALLSGVQDDLARLDAINAYSQDKGAVAASQAEAADAETLTGAAGAAERAAQAVVDSARTGVDSNVRRMSGLALALYVRFDLGMSPTSHDALTTAALTRGEMLGLVVARNRDQLAGARRALDDARKTLQQARDRVRQAKVTQAAAQQALTKDQAVLAEHRLAAAGHAVKPHPGLPLPTIMGPPALTADEIAGWFASRDFTPNVTVPMPALAALYLDASKTEGVRGDIAFAQSIIETGFFTFPTGGQLLGNDNNFAGIGACDSCAHGWRFPDAKTGVTAQLQLLHAYASRARIPTPLVGSVGVAGCCPTWLSLTGVWATASDYGYIILTVYRQMLDWALPQRLAAAGLS